MAEYKKSICAFMDILGYKNLVNEADKSNNALDKIKQLEALVNECIIEYIGKSTLITEEEKYSYEIFSDSIIITTRITKESTDCEYDKYLFNKLKLMTVLVAGIQIQALYYNVIFRGAISIGNHYRSERVMFSKALVNAYTAENKDALYPRIIIDKKYNEDSIFSSDEVLEALMEVGILLKDGEVYFIDFIRRAKGIYEFYEELYEEFKAELSSIITDGLSNTSQEVLDKYSWFAQYYNYSFNGDKIHLDDKINRVRTNFKTKLQHPVLYIYDEENNTEDVIDVSKMKPGDEIKL